MLDQHLKAFESFEFQCFVEQNVEVLAAESQVWVAEPLKVSLFF
jgi:hypothetical protein